LRGLSLDQTKTNLEAIIRQLREARVTVVLAGMKLPPNYGEAYSNGFETLYADLARRYDLAFIPFFLDGVAADPRLNQPDGIHPTGEGYRKVSETVFKTIEPLLSKQHRSQGSPQEAGAS
jgi:acyl-CoA thioesterase-1